jgi:hypothetical protein
MNRMSQGNRYDFTRRTGGYAVQHRISLLVVAVSLSASCSGTDAVQSPTQPTESGGALTVGVSTSSPIAVAERASNPFCPSVTPFKVPLVVVVQPTGGVSVVVTSIRLQFFDTSGAAAPQVTLPAPVPTTQFGSALASSRSGQSFPLTVGIGCGTGNQGTMQIVVETRDAQGRTGSGRATVSVR